MTLSWQISLVDDLIRENREATIGDYVKALARMEPRQKRLSGPLKRSLWPDRYNPGCRRWPPAKVYDPKLLTLSEEEKTYWRSRDEAFTKMIRRTQKQKQRA